MRSMRPAATMTGHTWVQVGSQIGNQASFDARNYGYRKLSDLVEATELFKVQRQNQIVLIRDKRQG